MEPQFSLFTLGSFILLGMIFGSFSSVLIYRWKHHIWGIWTGRSQCPDCHHTLRATELVPVFSYIFQWGKCASCKKPIPTIYPLLELTMGIWFGGIAYVVSSLSVPIFSPGALLLLIFAFITSIYIWYDILYMEIPDQALIPGIYLALATLFVSTYAHSPFLSTLYSYRLWESSLLGNSLLWAWVLYSFFYLQILIPGGIYALNKWNIRLFGEIILSYFLYPLHILSFWYFLKEESEEVSTEEIPTWIGGGDLRIALFIGLTLGLSHGVVSFVFAYILGSIFGIGYIIVTKNRKAQIAFGPFLWIGWMLVLFFSSDIDAYLSTFLSIMNI